MLGLPGSSGGALGWSFGWKLFWLAHASLSVPSTVKCSSDKSPFSRALSDGRQGYVAGHRRVLFAAAYLPRRPGRHDPQSSPRRNARVRARPVLRRRRGMSRAQRFTRITARAAICAGRPCIRDLRFAVSRLLARLAARQTGADPRGLSVSRGGGHRRRRYVAG